VLGVGHLLPTAADAAEVKYVLFARNLPVVPICQRASSGLFDLVLKALHAGLGLDEGVVVFRRVQLLHLLLDGRQRLFWGRGPTEVYEALLARLPFSSRYARARR
jgi:hypothetical protein